MKKRQKKLKKKGKLAASRAQKTSAPAEKAELKGKDFLETEFPKVEVLPAKKDARDGADSFDAVPELPEVSPPTSKEIIPYDALRAYLQEIRRYPPLTREQEKELAIRYHKHKDIQAAYQLVSSNLWLTVKIAKEYKNAAQSLLDLIQEGNIGLMEAVKNFDPYRGVRFPSYAVWWIKAYIVRYLIANWRMVKIGTTQAQRKLFFNLNKEKDKLEREGFYPAPKLLAEKLSVKESEVIEMEQRLGSSDVSVDAPLQKDTSGDLLSVLPADHPSAEELLEKKQFQLLLSDGINEFSETLNDKEAVILKDRLLSDEKATLRELAEKLSLSSERVRQLENNIKDKLKQFFIEKYGPSFQKSGL